MRLAMSMADCPAGLPYNGSMKDLARRGCSWILYPLLLALAGAATPLLADQPSPRVQALLAQMSREEKMGIIRGAQEPDTVFQGEAGWTRGVPRLGIPDLRFADGPPGVLVRHQSTGMPSPPALAATFHPPRAAAHGPP